MRKSSNKLRGWHYQESAERGWQTFACRAWFAAKTPRIL